MIYKKCVMTIDKNKATLDEDIYLYRLDKNIELYFTIVNNKYRFNKGDMNNIILITNASFFQVRLYKNAEIKYTFAIQPTDGGQAILTITDDLIDDPIETGDYDFQISLLDEEKTSMISMPIVSKQLHVCEPLVSDDATMGKAILGLSKLATGEIKNAFDSEGNYIREIHQDGDILSASIINKFEEALDTNTKAIKNGTGTSYDDTEIKTDINTIKTDLGTEELTTTAKDVKGAVNEVNAQFKEIAKKTIIENNKLYLAKEDGSKIDEGTELLFSTKQLDWYNVKEYGAVGDGVTDDSKAFNDLILSVYNDGGGVIYIPKGTYALISDSIYLLSNISFVGDGISKSILKPIYNGATFNKRFSAIDMNTKDISPYNLYGGDGEEGHKKLFENCIFKDFEIDGSGVVSTDNKYGVGLKGIFAYYMKNCLFEDLYIHDTIATGLGVDCLDKTFIRNIVVNNCGYGYGTYTGGTLGGAGIGIGTGYLANENFIITDCIATNCGSNGIFVEHQKLFAQDSNDGYDAEGSVITNCICRDNRNNGIGIRGGKKIRVTNNTVYNNDYGISLNTINAYSVLINNNIIKNNTTEDFYIDKIDRKSVV